MAELRPNDMTISLYRYPVSLLEEVDDLASELWGESCELVEGLFPPLDILGKKDDLIIRAELPGIAREDISIALEGDMLTIKGEKKSEEKEDDKDVTYYNSERDFDTFSRTVTLPFPVDPGKVTASLEKGVLEIRLTKSEAMKSRQIDIEVK